jgi:hypothetical protein
MKKLLLTLSLALALAVPAWADTPLGPDEFTSLDELAMAVASYFPKAAGDVKSVQNGQIALSIGRKDGIVPNMVLSLWREGKEILHPVTRAVIGRAEEEVGTVEVTHAAEASSTAVMKRQVKEPKAGDRARMSPRKVSLAVVPLRSEKAEIVEGVVERLNELGRFTVVEQPKITAFLKEHKQRDASLVRDLGAAFMVDAVVALTVIPMENRSLVTARVFYADETKPLDTIVSTLTYSSRREAFGDVRPFFAPVKEASDKSPELPVDARFFVIADVDGDGTAEYVFSDGAKLSVYRLEAGAWKEAWTERPGSDDRGQQQIALTCADINENGRPELFVTRMLNERVTSYVVEAQDGSFGRIADVAGFLRAMRIPGRGLVLAGQDYDPETFFAGRPREYRWTGSAYAAGDSAMVPKGMDLYAFALADFGEAKQLLVAFDKDDRLTVYSGDTPVWKSEETYRAADTIVTKPLSPLDSAIPPPSDYFKTAASIDKTRLVRIHGRILAADLDGNGTDDIMVPKNVRELLFSGYKGGEVHVLGWTGARLEPRWSMKELPGAVLDVQAVQGAAGGPVQVFALVKTSGGMFKKDSSRIERYEVK